MIHDFDNYRKSQIRILEEQKKLSDCGTKLASEFSKIQKRISEVSWVSEKVATNTVIRKVGIKHTNRSIINC